MEKITMELIQKRNKITFLIIVQILFIFMHSCTTNDNKQVRGQVFSKILAKEILNYMSLYEKEGMAARNTFSIWGDSINKDKYIFISMGQLCYDKNRIRSYTFLHDRLIIFNKPYDEFPFKGWINSDLLTKFIDSIPDYQECSSIRGCFDSEPIIRQLEIVSKDSLQIIDTKMNLYRSFLDTKIKYLQEAGKEAELEELYKKRLMFTMPAVQPVIEE